jgi:hypothetical protein
MATPFEKIDEAIDVAFDVSIGIGEGIAYPGLGGQVNDGFEVLGNEQSVQFFSLFETLANKREILMV